jgi:hypothetical protein
MEDQLVQIPLWVLVALIGGQQVKAFFNGKKNGIEKYLTDTDGVPIGVTLKSLSKSYEKLTAVSERQIRILERVQDGVGDLRGRRRLRSNTPPELPG